MSMRVCQRCSGYIPEAAAQCPHCRGGSPSALRIAALTLGASFALAAFVPGCAYGCPDGTCGEPLPPDAGIDAVEFQDAPTPDAAPEIVDAIEALPDAQPPAL